MSEIVKRPRGRPRKVRQAVSAEHPIVETAELSPAGARHEAARLAAPLVFKSLVALGLIVDQALAGLAAGEDPSRSWIDAIRLSLAISGVSASTPIGEGAADLNRYTTEELEAMIASARDLEKARNATIEGEANTQAFEDIRASPPVSGEGTSAPPSPRA